jgi:hypothetical protein
VSVLDHLRRPGWLHRVLFGFPQTTHALHKDEGPPKAQLPKTEPGSGKK